MFALSKEVYHVISFEPHREGPTSDSFHKRSVKLVRTHVIGIFWRATTREMHHITWIALLNLLNNDKVGNVMILGNQSHLTPQLVLNFLKQFEEPCSYS